MTLSPAIWVALGLSGPCLGSFAATAALRRADGGQAIVGRSRCDSCGVGLRYADTVPVISYLRLRGACGACGARIDARHVAGEIAGGVIVLSAFAVAASPTRAVLLSALGLTLLASAVHDLKTKRLPDAFTLALAVLGAGLAVLRSAQDLWEGMIAGAVAFVGLEVLRRAFIRFRGKPGLGFGDVKLLAALALWLGLLTPWAMAAASLGGLIAALIRPQADGRLAFGPWIAAAAWCVGLSREGGLWPSPV
ncbi:MAG TPA: A24 family peptidase [Caulobacteraceae bacterium]|nr:A24 family peptidase [Caulobacteraceae bacterium]